VYAASVEDGKTGVLFHSPVEFEERLRELIRNRDLRRRIAGEAYNWVKENRLHSQHYRKRYEWYLRMRDMLPHLNQELRVRVPELFEA
jgi:spore maturation protein CgeB